MTTHKIFERQGHYTQIDNLVFDELMQELTGNQFKILMTVIRKTIGWGKEQDKISLSQIMEITGISNKRSVIAAVKDLEGKGLILVHRPGGVEVNSFSLNRQYVSSGKSATTGSGKSATTGSGKSATHKRKYLKKEEETAAAPNSEQLHHKDIALKISSIMGYDKLPIKVVVKDLNTITAWLVDMGATVADVEQFGRYWWGDSPPSIYQVKQFWAAAMAQKTPTANPTKKKLTRQEAQAKYDLEFAL